VARKPSHPNQRKNTQREFSTTKQQLNTESQNKYTEETRDKTIGPVKIDFVMHTPDTKLSQCQCTDLGNSKRRLLVVQSQRKYTEKFSAERDVAQ
jgi:hypothetical protein